MPEGRPDRSGERLNPAVRAGMWRVDHDALTALGTDANADVVDGCVARAEEDEVAGLERLACRHRWPRVELLPSGAGRAMPAAWWVAWVSPEQSKPTPGDSPPQIFSQRPLAGWRSGDFEVRLRSEPHDDVVVSLSGGSLAVRSEPPGNGQVGARLDPAAGLLALWGCREPSAPIHLARGASNTNNRDALWCLFGC